MRKTKIRLYGIIVAILTLCVFLTACTINPEKKEPVSETVSSFDVLNAMYKSVGSANAQIGIFYDMHLNVTANEKNYKFNFSAGGDIKDNKKSKMVVELIESGKEIPTFGMYYSDQTFYFDISGKRFYISDFSLSKILALTNTAGAMIFDIGVGKDIFQMMFSEFFGKTVNVIEKNGVQEISTTVYYDNIQPFIQRILKLLKPTVPADEAYIDYDKILPGLKDALVGIVNDELIDTIVALFDFIPDGSASMNATIDNGVLTHFNIDGTTLKTEALSISLSTYNDANKETLKKAMPEFVNYTQFDFAVYEFVAEMTIKDVSLLAVVQLKLDIKNNEKNQVLIDLKDKKNNKTLLKMYYLDGSIFVDTTGALGDLEQIDLSKLGIPLTRFDDVFNLSEILNKAVGDILSSIKKIVGVNETAAAPAQITFAPETGEIKSKIDVNAILIAILSNTELKDGNFNLHLDNATVKDILSKLLNMEISSDKIIDLIDEMSKGLPVEAGKLLDGVLGSVGLSVEKILNGIGIDGKFGIVEKQPKLGIDIIFEEKVICALSLALTQIGAVANPLPLLTDEQKVAYRPYSKPISTHLGTTLTIPNTPFSFELFADVDLATDSSVLRGLIKYNDTKKIGSIKFAYELGDKEMFLDFTNFKALLPSTLYLTGLGFPMIRIKLAEDGSVLNAGGETEDMTDKLIVIISELINAIGYDDVNGIFSLTFLESGLSNIFTEFGVTLSDIDKKVGDVIGAKALDALTKILGDSIYKTIQSLLPLIISVSNENGYNVDISVAKDITIASFTNIELGFNDDFVLEKKENYTLVDAANTEWLSVATEGTVEVLVSEGGNAIFRSIINKLVGSDSFLGDVDVSLGTQPLKYKLNFALSINLLDMAKSQLNISLAIDNNLGYNHVIGVIMDGSTVYVDLKGESARGIRLKLDGVELFGKSPAAYYGEMFDSIGGNSSFTFAQGQLLTDSTITERIIQTVYDILGIENIAENAPKIDFSVIENKINLVAKIGEKIGFNGVLDKLTATYKPVVTFTDAEKLNYVPISLNSEENILTMLPVILPMIMPDFAIKLLKNSSEGNGSMQNVSVNRLESYNNGFRIYIDPEVAISAMGVTVNPKFSIEITGQNVAIKLIEMTAIGINIPDIQITQINFADLFGGSGNGSNNPKVYDKTTGQLGEVKYPDVIEGDIDRLLAPALESNGYSEKLNTLTFEPKDTAAKAYTDYEYVVFYPNRKVFDTVSNTVTNKLRDDSTVSLTAISGKTNADGTITVSFAKRAINILETYEIRIRAKAKTDINKASSLWSTILYDDAGGLVITNTKLYNSSFDDLSIKLSIDPLMLQKLLDNLQAKLVCGMLEGSGKHALAAKYHDGYAYYGTNLDDGIVNDIYQFISSSSTAIGMLDAASVKKLIATILPLGRIVDIAYLEIRIQNGELKNLDFVAGKANADGVVTTDGTITDNVLYNGKAECIVLNLIQKSDIDTAGIKSVQEIAEKTYNNTNISELEFVDNKYVPTFDFLNVTFTNNKTASAKVLWNSSDLEKVKVVIGQKTEYKLRYIVAGVSLVHTVIIDGMFGLTSIDTIVPDAQPNMEIYPFTDGRPHKMLPNTVGVVINGTLNIQIPVIWDTTNLDFSLTGGQHIVTAEIFATSGNITVEKKITVLNSPINKITLLPKGVSGDYTTLGKVLPVSADTKINVDVHTPFVFSPYVLITLLDGKAVVAAGEWDISSILYTSAGGEYQVTFTPKHFYTKYDNGETKWTDKEYGAIQYTVKVIPHTVSGISGMETEGNNIVLYISNPNDAVALQKELNKLTRVISFNGNTCSATANVVWKGTEVTGWTYQQGQYNQIGELVKAPGFVGKNTYNSDGGIYHAQILVNDITLNNIVIKVRGFGITAVKGFDGMTKNFENPFNKNFDGIFNSTVTATIGNGADISIEKQMNAVWDISALTGETEKVFGLNGKKYIVNVTLTDPSSSVTYKAVDITITFPNVVDKTFTLFDKDKKALTSILLNPNDPDFVSKMPRTVFINDGTTYYEIPNVKWIDENGKEYDLDNLDKTEKDYRFIFELGFGDKKVEFTLSVQVAQISYYTVDGTRYKATDVLYVNPYTVTKNSLNWKAKFYNEQERFLFEQDIIWAFTGSLNDIAGASIDATCDIAITSQQLVLTIVVYRAVFEAIMQNDTEIVGQTFIVDPLALAANKMPTNFTVRYNLYVGEVTTGALTYDKVVTNYIWSLTEEEILKISNFVDADVSFTKSITPHEVGESVTLTFSIMQYGVYTTLVTDGDKTKLQTIGETFTTYTDDSRVGSFSVKTDATVDFTWDVGTSGLTSTQITNKQGKIKQTKNGNVLIADTDFTVMFTTLLTPNRYNVLGGEGANIAYYYDDKGIATKGSLILPTSATILYFDTLTNKVANATVGILPNANIPSVASKAEFKFAYKYTASINNVLIDGTFPVMIKGIERLTFLNAGTGDNTTSPYTGWKNAGKEDATYTVDLNNPMTFLTSSFPILYVKKTAEFDHQETPNIDYYTLANAILTAYANAASNTDTNFVLKSGIRMSVKTTTGNLIPIRAYTPTDVDPTPLKITLKHLKA